MPFKALTNNLKVFSCIWCGHIRVFHVTSILYAHAVCSHKLQLHAFLTGLHSFNLQIHLKSPCVMNFFIVLPTPSIIAVCTQVSLYPFTWWWKSSSCCNIVLLSNTRWWTQSSKQVILHVVCHCQSHLQLIHNYCNYMLMNMSLTSDRVHMSAVMHFATAVTILQ